MCAEDCGVFGEGEVVEVVNLDTLDKTFRAIEKDYFIKNTRRHRIQ